MSQAAIDALNAQIAAAQGAAAAVVPAVVQAPSVPALANPGRPISRREVLDEAGHKVDKYLKAQAAGFNIGTDTTTYFEEIEVEFTLGSMRPCFQVRYGNPANYKKSYDRVTEVTSKRPWGTVIAEAKAADNNCRGDYPTADFAFEVVSTLTNKKGDALIEAGQILGHTPSVTNFKVMAQSLKPYEDLIDAGQLTDSTKLRAKLRHSQGTKVGVNPWGVINLDDVRIVSLGDETAEA